MKAKYFKVGDKVEFHQGGVGAVIELVGTKGIGLFCTVEWFDWKKRGNPGNCGGLRAGKSISISLPAIDKGREFNPIIRKKTT